KCGSGGGGACSASNQNTMSGLGFQPGVVLFTSVQEEAANLTNPIVQSMWGFGASDGTHETSSAIYEKDCGATNCISVVWGVDSATKAFTKMNYQAGASDTVAPVVEAQADVTINSDGFVVNWSPNDSAATEILYVAI